MKKNKYTQNVGIGPIVFISVITTIVGATVNHLLDKFVFKKDPIKMTVRKL